MNQQTTKKREPQVYNDLPIMDRAGHTIGHFSGMLTPPAKDLARAVGMSGGAHFGNEHDARRIVLTDLVCDMCVGGGRVWCLVVM